MLIPILISAGLLVVSAVIAARVVINAREKKRKAKEERVRLEREARERAEKEEPSRLEAEKHRRELERREAEEEHERLEREKEKTIEEVRSRERRTPVKRGGRPRLAIGTDADLLRSSHTGTK